MALQKSLGTERVGSNSSGEDCPIFYLGVTAKDNLIGKTEVEKTLNQSTFLSRTPSLQSARFSHLRDANFLTNPDRVLSGISPLLGGIESESDRPSSSNIINEKNHERSQTPTPD